MQSLILAQFYTQTRSYVPVITVNTIQHFNARVCVQSPHKCQIVTQADSVTQVLFLSVLFDILTVARSHAEASCRVLPGTLKEQELIISLSL